MSERSVVIRLRGEIGDFQAKMVAAGKSVNDVAHKMVGAEKESAKFRKGLDSLGTVGGRVGLVAAAGLGAAIATAANFDQAMSKVAAATHESTENMDALREAAIQAGADTAFSASEAAAGIENLAKAGVQTQEILGGGLQGALDLAAAGTIEVSEAAEVAATAMTQFGLSGEQVPHIADLLAAAAGKAQGEVSDMGMALKQSGLVADQVGLSIEETTGGLAAFASAGLLGSDAGTSFKTMLGALTPNSEKAAGAMESLGIHAYDAGGNFVGLAQFAGNLREGLADLTDQQRQATLETIFGQDAVRAASVLYEQGADGVQSWIDKVDDSGYAAETASIKLDNLKGDLEAFKGSLETALIGVGEGSQGPLRSLVQGATDAVNAFNALPPAAQSTTSALLAVTAAIGGGIFVGSKVVQGIANTSDALTNLGISADKSTKAMKGLAATGGLVAGLGLATTAIIAVRNAADESLPSLETLTNQLLNVAGTDLPSEFDSITESLRRLNDKSFEEGFGDWLTPWESGEVRRAKQEIDALDAAFANIATQAGPEKALATFDEFARSMGLTVSEQRDLLDRMPQLGEAFAGTANGAELAADGVDGYADAATTATRATLKLSDAMSALFDGLDLDATTDAWRDSIKGLTDDLTGGSGALSRNTEEGRANREEIRGRLQDLRAMAEAQYEVTGDTEQLTQTLLRGRQAIIDQAVAAGISKDAMHAYLHELGLTPKEIRTTIALMNAPQAEGQLDDLIYKARILKSELQAMSRTRIDIRARGEGGLDGYASGGYTGNVSPSSVAGVVHGREFVFDAQMTAMYRPLFEAMHRTRKVPGYREGGYVAAQSSTTNYYSGGEGIDYDRLARALARVRPLYGDVKVYGDGSFRRELMNDARANSLDGVR